VLSIVASSAVDKEKTERGDEPAGEIDRIFNTKKFAKYLKVVVGVVSVTGSELCCRME
jgi:hypothetical protein